MSQLEAHPFADLFPLMTGSDFDELARDISQHGLKELIVIHEGKILDGRNRYRAGVVAGRIAAEAYRSKFLLQDGYREFGSEVEDGDDPLAFVISKNLKRRHLNESQRAMVASKLAGMSPGRPAKNAPIEAVSQEAAARQLNVGRSSVQRAAEVRDRGAPELVAAVESGAATVSAAADIATLPVDEQIKVIQSADPKAFRAAAKEARAKAQAEKKARRAERERELAGKVVALPEKRYGVILADPEWQFDVYSRETGLDRAAENHYPTSALDEIKERPVWDIAAKDCALFLWATPAMLLQALDVMSAWGFEYKTQVIWHKIRPGKGRGTGYWFTGEHEILLVGTRGNVPAPAPGSQFPSIFQAPVGEHSAKPGRAAEIIETYFPTLPKIELNRRGAARPGWDAWGNEVDEIPPAEAAQSGSPPPVEAAGGAPAGSASGAIPATESQAKASEDNGATAQARDRKGPADSVAGDASRPDAGRTASATSERMDATAGRDRHPISDDEPDMPEFLRRSGSWSDENLPSRRGDVQ